MTSRLRQHAPTTLRFACVLLVAGCSDGQRRDATEEEVRSAAGKCGAVITHFRRSTNAHRTGPSNREMGIPNVAVTIDVRGVGEFDAKANCIDRELAALGAYSNIGGQNGEDLLVSSGRD